MCEIIIICFVMRKVIFIFYTLNAWLDDHETWAVLSEMSGINGQLIVGILAQVV